MSGFLQTAGLPAYHINQFVLSQEREQIKAGEVFFYMNHYYSKSGYLVKAFGNFEAQSGNTLNTNGALKSFCYKIKQQKSNPIPMEHFFGNIESIDINTKTIIVKQENSDNRYEVEYYSHFQAYIGGIISFWANEKHCDFPSISTAGYPKFAKQINH